MTATTTNTFPPTPEIAPSFSESFPLVLNFRAGATIPGVLARLGGMALVLASALMWVMPGSQFETELVLIKLGASVLFLMAGVVLLVSGHPDNRPDAYFDPIRREVRILQKNKKGRPTTVLRRSYDSLGSVRFAEQTVELYDLGGQRILSLPLESVEARTELRKQLFGLVDIRS